jgi:hypothetical protein
MVWIGVGGGVARASSLLTLEIRIPRFCSFFLSLFLPLLPMQGILLTFNVKKGIKDAPALEAAMTKDTD